MSARSDAACSVGIDLHQDTLTARTIAAQDRGESYRKIACVARETIREFLAGLRSTRSPAPEEVRDAEVPPRLTEPSIVKPWSRRAMPVDAHAAPASRV